MTFSKIGNKKCGSPFLRMMNPNTGNAETGCRFFRYRPPDGVVFFRTSRGERTVFQNKSAIWWESCSPKKEDGGSGLFSPENLPPSAKGWSDFRLHNQGVLGPILGLLEAATIDHESICFIEHPSEHTPSGLRADNPVHRKSFPTHPQAGA